jgi:hypothetical protein
MVILDRLGPLIQFLIFLGIVGSLASIITVVFGVTGWTSVFWLAQEDRLASVGINFYEHNSLLVFSAGLIIASSLLALGTLGYALRHQSIIGLVSAFFFVVSIYYSSAFFNSLLTWVHPEQLLEYREWSNFKQLMQGATGTFYMSFTILSVSSSMKRETQRYGFLTILISLIGIVIMGTDIRLTHLSTLVMPVVYIMSMMVFNSARFTDTKDE